MTKERHCPQKAGKLREEAANMVQETCVQSCACKCCANTEGAEVSQHAGELGGQGRLQRGIGCFYL